MRMLATERRATVDDPWNCIRVFRRLDVGPVRVEPQRVIATYTLTTDDGASSIDFVYRYEQPVFDPTDPIARNLGSMITAQLALNYGLFTDEIRFDGLFDEADRQLLREMAENTAREITVKKFLEHNPFLLGRAASLPVMRRDKHCWARLRFVDTARQAGKLAPATTQPWGEHESRHAVLSSGGKESLLTFGILQEIGREVYPIFLNESGRHWLTALNGYRHLSAHHAGTARVWTNCDRVFAWFLRHMPFVRQDFANVRSDEYPIRLWTVAVFLFGALPLLRLNRIGRISIGDEFDTSRRCRHRGIHHYDGLYDQSRYFDRAFTGYFSRKGYRVEQFSLLRCMSEMLIQQTLAERYPDLFEHQVSCHAAHVAGDRVRPCGKCEKCRRVVAMLVAFDLDPVRCGYTRAQVDDCIRQLAAGAVNQETEAAQHLAHILTSKGMLPHGGRGLPPPRARTEVVKLRFDAQRAAWEDLPADLREPVYRILLEHAEGAVSNDGRSWVEFDPLANVTF
jgi:hypothetical protein